MKPNFLMLFLALAWPAAWSATAAPLQLRQEAPPDGWAAQAGGTRGGADATAVVTVSDAAQLRRALDPAIKGSRIVLVDGVIDMSEGRPYASTADQARRGLVRLPSNTTLAGAGAASGFINAQLLVAKVEQVVIRNLNLRNPCDVAPEWDPQDGPTGGWNAQFDAISIVDARHVWVDHNSFTDAPVTDDTLPVEHGKPKQCHDGALDIRDASDFVTVSYNHFALHAKTMLIGASDKAVGDADHLRITLSNNLFEHVTSRAPRVRFGQVHLFNNYYVGERRHPSYKHGYSVGVAFGARIVSHANAFEIADARDCTNAVSLFASATNPGAFKDQGSLLNGGLLGACSATGDPGWTVPYAFAPIPAADVPAHVRAHAGAGKQAAP